MSRSGYSDELDSLDLGRWRGQIASATRGKRGQAFFKALVEALDAMPDKRLIRGDLQDETGCVCTLGALARHRGLDPLDLDTYDYDDMGKRFNAAHQLMQEVMFENDDAWGRQGPEERWGRMRKWAAEQIHAEQHSGGTDG